MLLSIYLDMLKYILQKNLYWWTQYFLVFPTSQIWKTQECSVYGGCRDFKQLYWCHIFYFFYFLQHSHDVFFVFLFYYNHHICIFSCSSSVLQPQHHNQYIELFLCLFPKALSINHDIRPHLDKAVELLWQYAISIPYGFNEKSASPCK